MDGIIYEKIKFGDIEARVYYKDGTDEPIFKVKDIFKPVDLRLLEYDEYFLIDGEYFITELGLYNWLSQTDSKDARLWRRVIHEQLINIRKEHNKTIMDQFEDLEQAAGEYYFDEDTGRMMRSVTVAGGDVIQEEV